MNPIIRPATEADIPGIARVHVDTWRTAYRGIVDAGYLESLSYEDFEKRRRERLATAGTRTFVGEVGGEVVAFATAGPNRELDGKHDAELYAIYVRNAYARRGIGRALVAAVAGWLAAEKRRAMILWVLRDNAPSKRFYESLGGAPAGEKEVRFGTQDLPHAAYGWPDVASLASRLST
ncbi:MAG: GNAT family N-acetyltransferase [Planctomycetota bacterium]